MKLFKKRKQKKTYIYLTPLGKIIALGECALRAREEGIPLDKWLERELISEEGESE